MQEAAIERYLAEGVKAQGGLCLKWVSPGFTGVPDRIILMPAGRIYFAELKAPGKKARPRQVYVQNLLIRLGFTVFSPVDSIGLVDQIIRQIGRR